MRRFDRILVVVAGIWILGSQVFASGQQAPSDPNVVAIIGPYVITGDQFRQEYLRELMPNPYTAMPPRPAPDMNDVLMRMIGDKAIILDARDKGMQKKEEIVSFLKQTRERRLANLAAQQAVDGRIEVSQRDINDVMATRPGLTTEQAAALVRRQKAMQVLSSHYKDLIEMLHLRTYKENIAKVAEFHQRLISKPKPPEKKSIYWIENSQLKTDLDPNERALVLATFDGGRFTVEDWFLALFEMAPPRRPKDLSTPEGAERFLEQALQRPMFAAEAIKKGLDKDSQLDQDLRDLEDQWVFSFAQQELLKDLHEPNDQDLNDFYQQVKDKYARNDSLKLAVIWCKDKAAAARIRQELDQGRAFELLQQRYGGDQNPSGPVEAYARTEGPFWQQLWAGEPNQVLGPMLGFREGRLAWRVVKIVEKKPAQPPEFEKIKNMLKEDLAQLKGRQLLEQERKELLAKYKYQVFPERLASFDPRQVP
ncbi:MAG: peptidylprolyl isomerase [Sedimentisphaerales bacterium]|nr:peptidylprolyl isomerase [Sedimentisphaerales bacterium]